MPRKTDRFMPLEIEPWNKKTARLPAAARGAYLDLLLAYWRGEKLPADDDDALMRIARCTEKEWASVRDKVLAYFVQDGSVLRQERADEEKAKAERQYEVKASSGQTGGKQSGKQRRSKIEPKAKQEPEQEAKQTATADEQIRTLEQSPIGDVQASPGAEAPLKARLFGPCLDWLAKATKKDPSKLRPLVGQWCSKYGDGKTLEAISAAQVNASLDPIPYITRILAREGWTRGGGQTPGGVADTVARLKAEAGVEGPMDQGAMGRGSGEFHAPGYYARGQGPSGGPGAPVFDADDAERMFRVARGNEADHGEPSGAGERFGSAAESVSAQDAELSARCGASRSHDAAGCEQVVADVAGTEGTLGRAHGQEAGDADGPDGYPKDFPDHLKRNSSILPLRRTG